MTLDAPVVQILTIIEPVTTIVTEIDPVTVVVTEGIQGPPGPPGPKGDAGPVGDAGGALLVLNRLAELAADPFVQEQAQANLGLGTVDPLAYYILAKA